ncbi:MAG TPA: phosphoenolpyruvate--protein phosphotransferase [Rhizomicrobium sp.]|nr:phosphoenolpyruvate--protein phosphotransferase [Rhizomicrobium sp.]
MSPGGGPRLLLRRLREIMAEQTSAQMRLDKLVTVIASNMVAEVCSIYLRRAGKVLELFATEGLRPDAVHKTRLKEGEGLVGLVSETAEAVNLSDAPADPHFSYRPETGEDPFKSFLGVPIVRGGQVFGVLTVQNKAERIYAEEEVEALQTVAMVLAEVVAQGGFFNVAELDEPELRIDRPRKFVGDGLSEGVAVGRVVLHEPRVKVDRMIADNPVTELKRLEDAIAGLRESVDEMLSSSELDLTGEGREVIEAYRLFAYDQGWRQRMRDAVRTGLTAEAAVERVQDETRLRVQRMGDPILRERAHDFDDLARRLLRHLTGEEVSDRSLPQNAVLVARGMGPAELLDYGREKLVALVLEEAAATSHVAIVARSMGLPMVASLEGVADNARAGDGIAVDGEMGEVHLRPAGEIVKAFEDKRELRVQAQARFAAVRDLPAVTRDGVAIKLMMNAGLEFDMPQLMLSGADGIGLFRTELQFMISATFPRLEQQTRLYKAILDAAGDRPVVFRSLDVGGDKVLPYFRAAQEENPAIGWRAIRMALDRPALFRTQVRALLRASAGRELRIMLPMISDVSEFTAARALIDREVMILKRHGRPEPKKLMVGAMIEVPALLWQLDTVLPLADFASVGSNDLMQFLFAADRGNMRVSERFDSLNPAALKALKQIADAAKRHEVPLTLCGEMAGRPLEAMTLIGLGFRAISMAPASVGPVKAMVLSLDTGNLARRLEELLETGKTSVREDLKRFAAEQGVQI